MKEGPRRWANLNTHKHRWRDVIGRVTTAGPYADAWFSTFALSIVVAAGILSVAATDKAVEPELSVAPLYFLPLALSALLYPLRIGVGLSIVCLLLHHLIGTVPQLDAKHLKHDAATLAGYLFVVIVVNRLGQQRLLLAEAAQQQRDELAVEIQLAAEVQQSILPRSVPAIPRFDVAARMYPAKTVAGDYYGFFELPDGSVALVIADVSGKGVAAGLLMPSIEIALRLDSPRHARTHELIEGFNGVVCQLTGGARFISLFYGRLWPVSGRLEFTNAGHNPPLLLRTDSPTKELLSGGPVLGVVPQARYEDEVLELKKGDLLVLYTDGLVEAENSEGEFYSAQRLEAVARSHIHETADKISEAIYASVTEFRANRALDDDATLIVARVV